MGIFSQRGAFPKPGIRQLPYSPFGGRARNMRFNPYQQQRPQPFMGGGMGGFNPPQQRPQSLAGGPSITNRERREALHARHEMLPDESRTKQRLARYIGDLDDAFAASGESASAFPGMQQINADVYSDDSSLSPSDMAEIQATAPPPQAQAMAPPPQAQAMAPPPQAQAMAPFEDSGMPWDETQAMAPPPQAQAMAPPPQAQAMAPFQMAAPAPAMPPQPVAPRPSRRDYGDEEGLDFRRDLREWTNAQNQQQAIPQARPLLQAQAIPQARPSLQAQAIPQARPSLQAQVRPMPQVGQGLASIPLAGNFNMAMPNFNMAMPWDEL